MKTDEQHREHFLARINQGDIAAYDTLYKTYYELMTLYAFRLTNDAVLAEDVVQDVFTSIWERRVQFADYRAIRPYLYRAVHNECVNHNIHPRSRQIAIDEGLFAESIGHAPDTSFMEEEIYRLLFAAIDRLPKRCREVMLKSLEGKKNGEISEEMELSVETVKTQKRRGLTTLRKLLDDISTEIGFLSFASFLLSDLMFHIALFLFLLLV